MADGRRRQIAPVRKLVAAVLGTLATFIILFGAGMTSWAIVALGVALLILAIGLVAVTSVRGGARAWVAGIGHVHSVSEPPASSAFGRCELQIVIDAPGVPARSVKIRDPRVPVSKWPDPGATLPIMVAIDDQRHVRILWDEVLTHAEAAASTDLPPPFDDIDPLGDDVLIEQDAPPWADTRDHDQLNPPGGVPHRDDLADDLAGLREEPVVVRQTPGGTIVLEGTVVDPPPPAALPRRPRPTPGPGGRPRRPSPVPSSAATLGPTQPDVATGDPVAGTPGPDTDPPAARSATDRPEVPPAQRTAPDPTPSDAPTPDLEHPTARMPSPAPIPEPRTPEQVTPEPTRPEPPTVPQQATGRRPEPVDDEIDVALDDPEPAPGPDPAAKDDRAPIAGSRTGAGGHIGPAQPDAGRGTPDDAALAADDEAFLADLRATAQPGQRGGSGPIAGVGITLLVTDLDRSVAFYRDMLGFLEIDGGEGNAVLASGSTRLVLRAIPEVAPINRRLVHLNLEVDDIDTAHQDLLAKGVRFTYAPRAVNRGAKLELWAAAFRDPDGHGIALTQWRDRTSG